MSKRHFFPILGPPKRIFKFHPLFVHPRPRKTWKPQHPEGFSKRSAAPARPRVAKARISYHQATASPDLRAAAPAADPGINHQERCFFSLAFLNIKPQILEHEKSPQTLEKPCCPRVWVDFIRIEDMAWYLVFHTIFLYAPPCCQDVRRPKALTHTSTTVDHQGHN